MSAPASPAPDRKLLLLILTATSDRGGEETLMAAMLPRLDARRFACRVVSMSGGGWLTSACQRLGFPAQLWRRGGPFARARALWRLLREFQPDVIHAFGLRAELPARLLARPGCGARLVCAAHSVSPRRPHWQVLLDRATAGRVDQWIAVSQTVAEARRRRERIPARKLLVIPNGIEPPAEERLAARAATRADLARRLEIPENPAGPLLLMVANQRPMKGYSEALRAVAALRSEFPGLRLIAVGRDVSGGEYARQARALGCEANVLWAGYQEDPAPFYAAADLFLLPSHWEGCPAALLEAMAWALPIAASRIGAVEELVRHEREALLFAPRDADALAAAIRRALGSPVLARELAAAARRRLLERFTLDRMARAHESLYERLAAGAPGA